MLGGQQANPPTLPWTSKSEPFLIGRYGHTVAFLVFRMTGVTEYVSALHLMLGEKLIEPLPQFEVFHRARLAATPSVSFPLGHPFAETFRYILTVGD